MASAHHSGVSNKKGEIAPPFSNCRSDHCLGWRIGILDTCFNLLHGRIEIARWRSAFTFGRLEFRLWSHFRFCVCLGLNLYQSAVLKHSLQAHWCLCNRRHRRNCRLSFGGRSWDRDCHWRGLDYRFRCGSRGRCSLYHRLGSRRYGFCLSRGLHFCGKGLRL